MNNFFSDSFGSFNEQNERIDSEKDLFILMNKFFSTEERMTWTSWMTWGGE